MMTYKNNSFSKRLLIALLSIGVSVHLAGCSSSGSSDEESSGGEETFAEESSGDFADGEEAAETTEESTEEVAEGGDEASTAEDEIASEEAGTEDEMALDEEAGGEEVAATDGEEELSLDDEEGLPEDVASNEPAPIVDPVPVAPVAEATPEPAPPTDAQVFNDPPADTATEVPSEPSEPVAAASWVPVKKIKSSAFMVDGTNLNRVYIARPGDTRPGIATKLYGDKSRSRDLLKWNSGLGRGVKTGDKVYYSSPSNPTDGNMLTYYEDVGIPPQHYMSQEGDNIRTVSKSLLGNGESWKEVWATNPDVESKGTIPAGLSLRYWPEGTAAPPILAQNNQPPPMEPPPVQQPMEQPPMDPMANQPPPMDPVAQMPVEPPPAMEPPPAPVEQPVAQQPPPPPPEPTAPPAAAAVQPPPAPPKDPPQQAAMEEHSDTEEADQMMKMGLAGIFLVAVGGVLYFMRRNRARKVDLTQTTQVG